MAKLTKDELTEFLAMAKTKLKTTQRQSVLATEEAAKKIDEEMFLIQSRKDGEEASARAALEREIAEIHRRHEDKLSELKIQRANAVNKAREEQTANLLKAEAVVKKLEEGLASLDNQAKVDK